MRQENLFTPGCIRTFTGKYVNPSDARNMEICIDDIAHALSQQPRFGGHLPRFYSVAQHCIHVTDHLPPELKLAGLLHDASEAYLIDVPRPVKEVLVNYKMIENKVMTRIAHVFGFDWPLHDEVKKADELELHWEWNNLMINQTPPTAFYLTPTEAETKFLELFKVL